MRQLIWKELREQRYVPVAHAGIVAVVILLWYAMSAWALFTHYPNGRLFTAGEAVPFFYLGLSIVGLFCGSGAFAPEIGSGTLSFLATTPTGRPRIWVSKVAAGLITMALSAIAVLAAYSLTVVALFGSHARWAFPGDAEPQWVIAMMLVCAIYGYFVCLFVSTMVDRTVVAAALGLVIAVGGVAAFGVWTNADLLGAIPVHDRELITMGMLAMPSVAFGVASYVGFCTGSILLPGPRRRRSATVLTSSLAISALVFVLVGPAINKVAAAQQALYLKTIPKITYDEVADSGAYWNHLKIHAEFRPDNREGRIDVMLVNPRQNIRQMTDALSTSRPNPDASFYQTYRLSHRATAAYVDPVSVTGGNAFFQASLIRPNCVEIALHRQQAPGTVHDTVHIVDKDGRSLGTIDIENVTL